MRALVIVDVQEDFCEGGALPVKGGSDVATKISEYLEENSHLYDAVVAVRDWHVDPGEYFVAHDGEEPDFTESWPVHCVAGTQGAELHPNLDTEFIDAQFVKGRFDGTFSAFDGLLADPDTVDSDAPEGTVGPYGATAAAASLVDEDAEDLDTWLRKRKIEALTIVGIATDHGVLATAMDAADAGYDVKVLLNLTRPFDERVVDDVMDEMEDNGVHVAQWNACPPN